MKCKNDLHVLQVGRLVIPKLCKWQNFQEIPAICGAPDIFDDATIMLVSVVGFKSPLRKWHGVLVSSFPKLQDVRGCGCGLDRGCSS